MEREKVNLDGKEKVYIYESDREITMEEIRENCEANDWPVPEEDSREYWDEVTHIREWDWESFEDGLKYTRQFPGNVLVTGHCGLWDGPRGTCCPVRVDDVVKFFRQFVPNTACYEFRVGYDGDGLFVEVPHHDGTNFHHVREITPEGLKYLEQCEEDDCDPVDIEKYTTPIDWYFI